MDRPVVLLDMACSMTLGLGLSYNLVGRPTAYEPSVLRCDANTCTHLKQPWDNLHVSLCLGYVLAMVFPYHARACFVADTTLVPASCQTSPELRTQHIAIPELQALLTSLKTKLAMLNNTYSGCTYLCILMDHCST